MSLAALVQPFPWTEYSQRLRKKIVHPLSIGFFSEEEAEEKKMFLASAEEGAFAEGNYLKMYWLVDREDGVVADARYQLFGQALLFGALEVAVSLVIGKNYDQARRIDPFLLDKEVRDRDQQAAFPEQAAAHLALVLSLLEKMAAACQDLPLPENYVSPFTAEVKEKGEYPGWDELPLKKQLAVIEAVLDEDLRPYIALDGGGVEVLNILHRREVIITYQGACTSCYSSVGATLSYIQQTFRAKVHPEITVVPDMSGTDFASPY